MSLNREIDAAASGLSAQRLRMELASANMANSETTRTPEGGPYRKRSAVFARKTRVSASTSIGSPSGVAVPWAST